MLLVLLCLIIHLNLFWHSIASCIVRAHTWWIAVEQCFRHHRNHHHFHHLANGRTK